MSQAIPDIQPLASSLEALTLRKDYSKGPQWELGDSPALEYPPLPDAEPEGNDSCYLLGWPLHEVSERLLTVAGCEGKRLGEPGYDQVLTQAMHFLWNWGNYRHIWTTAIPKEGIDPTINDAEEDCWFLTISCSKEKNSADSRVDRRPNKAQFKWLRDVLGKDPRWVLADRSLYAIVEAAVWARASCCASWGKDQLRHLVDLETGEWKRDLE